MSVTFGTSLRWLVLFAFSLWALLSLERWLWAAEDTQAVREGLFLVGLASATVLPVAVFWRGAAWLAERWPARSRYIALATSALVGLCFWRLASPIAQGDGVQDLPLEPAMIPVFVGCAGLALSLMAWHLERMRRVLSAFAWQLALSSVLTAFALAVDRLQADIASAALIFAALIISGAVARTLALSPRLRRVTSIILSSAIAAALLASGLDPAGVDRGRRSVLSDQRVPLGLHTLLFGADEAVLRSARLSLSGLTPKACAGREQMPLPAPLTSDPARRRNVLLLSIDALRSDALGAQLHGQRVAPHLFAWSQEAQHFRRATTSYAATFFAVSGALTGLPASRIALLPTPPRTLFSMTRKKIPRRLALMPSSGSFFKRLAFARYALGGVTTKRANGAREQVSALLEFIASARRAGEPFFSWTHFGEPHAPYHGHPGVYFGDSERERYLAEVAYVDSEFGRLISALRRDGSLDDTLIIVFADHGEALGERGHHGHHVFLNRWIAEVPLILHVPSGERARLDAFAQTSDIAPTVLHFLGLASPHTMTGRSLLDAQLDADRALVAEAFSTGTSLLQFAIEPIASQAELRRRMDLVQRGFGRYAPSVSITQGTQRVIVNRHNGLTALYDTQRDPQERHDLSLERPARLSHMLDKLAAWHREQSLAVYCATLEHLDERLIE